MTMRLGAVPRNLAGTSQDSGSVLFPHIGIAWLMIEGPWLDPADFFGVCHTFVPCCHHKWRMGDVTSTIAVLEYSALII